MPGQDRRFSLLGCDFEIRDCVPVVWRAIEERLPPVAACPPGTVLLRRYSVAADGGGFIVERARRRPVPARTPSAAADLVVDDVERAISRSMEGRILVHSGAVRWHGRAILVPGRSGSGKSELVAELVRAGADYLSDEFAVLDRDGTVHPYRRPVTLRRRTGPLRFAPATPAGRPANAGVTVGTIAFLKYRPGAVWHPRPVSAGAALLGLLRNTLSCRIRLDDARSILRQVAAGARAFASERDDAQEITRLILAGAS